MKKFLCLLVVLGLGVWIAPAHASSSMGLSPAAVEAVVPAGKTTQLTFVLSRGDASSTEVYSVAADDSALLVQDDYLTLEPGERERTFYVTLDAAGLGEGEYAGTIRVTQAPTLPTGSGMTILQGVGAPVSWQVLNPQAYQEAVRGSVSLALADVVSAAQAGTTFDISYSIANYQSHSIEGLQYEVVLKNEAGEIVDSERLENQTLTGYRSDQQMATFHTWRSGQYTVEALASLGGEVVSQDTLPVTVEGFPVWWYATPAPIFIVLGAFMMVRAKPRRTVQRRKR